MKHMRTVPNAFPLHFLCSLQRNLRQFLRHTRDVKSPTLARTENCSRYEGANSSMHFVKIMKCKKAVTTQPWQAHPSLVTTTVMSSPLPAALAAATTSLATCFGSFCFVNASATCASVQAMRKRDVGIPCRMTPSACFNSIRHLHTVLALASPALTEAHTSGSLFGRIQRGFCLRSNVCCSPTC